MSDLIRPRDAIEAVVCHIWHMPNEVYKQFNCENTVREVVEDAIKRLPPAETVDCTDFVLWLLDEIMDEENWECNAVANGEIIARKLKKLGLLGVKDGYYVRTPSAEAVQGWIPVSDRLPEEYGEYLVTKRTIGWNCEEYGSNDIAYFDSDGFHKADKVTAWMPLPEPYKGGDSE